MNSKTALVLLGLVAFVYSQTLVVSSTAFFSNVVCGSSGSNPCSGWVCGGANQSTCASYGATYADSSLPPYQSRWGTPVGQVKSGLGYSPISSVSTQIDSDFYVGTLTHFNFPINSGTAAASVQLNLIVSFKTTGGANVATQSFSFTLSIDETPNGTPCTYSSSTPCSDKISYPAGGFDRSSSFTYNDVSYTLQLKGFKESTSSLSSPIVDFISNENGSRLGYLFARITAACPTSCVGGGSVIITPDSRCVCDCSSATACVSPQVFAPDCSCVCPSSTCRNGTVVKTPTGCTCDCSSVPCASPRQQAADCSCACPTNYCNGYPINNPTTCACSCPTAAELGCGANFVVDSRCQCSCPLTDASCGANKVENPNPNICGCICDSTTCQTNFQKDPVTCGCVCSLSCPNGEVLPNCTCGNCVGNFQLNVTTGQCTGCSLSADNCTGGNSFDASACRCVCDQLVCNLYNNSEVVDSTKDCACRPCVAGECICGNGKIEVGEDCDLGPNVTNPCCVNCKFTTDACTDPNLCNANGVCDGAGQCSGRYKCPPNSVCTSYTCDPNVGDCVANVQPNGTACFQFTGQPLDLCVRSCQGGTCVDYTAENGLLPDCSDNDPADCQVPRCDSATGTCVFDILPDNTPCSDGLSCTLGDICLSGNCTGTPRDCTLEPLSANLTVCNKVICEEFGLYYSCSVVPDRVGQSCDDGNACTLNDVCSPQGECIPSRKTVRCPRAEPCKTFTCDRLTGQCIPTLYGNETVCNDKNNCTVNDRCDNGTCVGYPDDNTALLAECGFVPPTPSNPAGTNSIIVLAAVLGAALVAGIAAVALIVKKIQKARLLDPDTWNPDAFSSVGANPFYQASQKMVDSPLYEGN